MNMHPTLRFLVLWGVNTLSLWVADALFDGIWFATPQSLLFAGLMLGMVNTFLKPESENPAHRINFHVWRNTASQSLIKKTT